MFCTGGSAWPLPTDPYVIAVGGVVVQVTTWGALVAGLVVPLGGVVLASSTLRVGDTAP